MGASTKESGLFSMIAMVLAAAMPLIAVPTAMLTMSSRESGSDNKPLVSPKGQAEKKTSQLAKKQKELMESPDRLLKEFFGRNLEDKAETVLEECLKRSDSKVNVRGLIVTLPDPQNSSLTYLFDVRLDVLRKAAATHGYTVNRFCLPWRRDRSESGTVERPRTEPGLLLFRRGHSKSQETDLLLMYLVGETPTTGVQIQAFDTAVTQLLFWTQQKPSQHQNQNLDVIGPSFSGTADSLARAIRAAKTKHIKFRVVSGAANSLDQPRFEMLSGNRASLHSTQPSAERCQSELLQFVRDHQLSIRPLRIAWLVESSGFGIDVSQQFDQKPGDVAKPAKVLTPAEARKRKAEQDHEEALKKAANQKIEITNFSFPLHVARVRRELEKQRSKRDRSPLHAATPNESRLEFGDEEASARQDVTPIFAPEISPALDELQLRQMMTTVRQGEFSYVGITATDPRDIAFLCELIRQHCPDAQILLIGGSTTFVHPTQRQFMRGALTATGYPLHLSTQSWTFPWGANPAPPPISGNRPPSWMVTPDSDSSAGVYNAAVLLLANSKQGTWKGSEFILAEGENSEAKPELQLVDYGEPYDLAGSGGFQPTVWISAIGNETVVPLAARRSIVLKFPSLSPPLMTVTSPPKAPDRRPRVVFPFAGGVFALLIVALTAYAWLISLALARRGGSSRGHEVRHHRGWWRTWTDDLIPILLPRDRKRPPGARYSPRKRQLGALLLAALGMWLLTTWLAGLAFVPVILNAHSAGNLCFWVSLSAMFALFAAGPFIAAWIDARCRTRPGSHPPEAIHHRTWLPRKVRRVVGVTVGLAAILYATGIEFRNLAGESNVEITHWLGMLACFLCACFWLAAVLSFLNELSNFHRKSRRWVIRSWWCLRCAVMKDHSHEESRRWTIKCWRWMRGRMKSTKLSGESGRWVITAFLIQTMLAVVLSGWSGLKLDGHGGLDGEWAKWALLRFSQTMSITNHVSLLQSTLWLVLAIIAWCGFVLRRLLVSEQHQDNMLPWERMPAKVQAENPLAAVSARMTHTKVFIDEVLATGCQALRRNFAVSFVVTFSAALLWLAHLARWSALSFDSAWITWAVWIVGGVAVLAWVHTFWQAIVLRQMIHKLLRQMAWMTMLTESMGRLPERVRVVVGSFMDIRRTRASYFRIRVHYLTYLLKHLAVVQQQPHWAKLLTEDLSTHKMTPESEHCIKCVLFHKIGRTLELYFCDELQLIPIASGPQDQGLNPIPVTRETLNHFGLRVWNGLLHEWRDRPPQKLYPSGNSSDDELSHVVKKFADSLSTLNRSALPPALRGKPDDASEDKVSAAEWVRTAEEFVAMQVVGYLHNVLTFLYSLIWFLLAMTVLFLLGTLTWPLQPQKLLSATAITMLLMVTLFCVLALLALERDRVHSILRGTTPGRIDFDRSVLLKLATCLAPVAFLLSSYIFPSAIQWLTSLVEPVMHSAQ